jgi:putative DNA methylase
MTDCRFIEESFPVKEVSAISAREKNIRHGHISTLHIWWARRPLAASRATAYAALTPATDDITEWQRRRDFIVELSKWENSLDPHLLERARREILEASGGKPLRVLDPFAGGGAIPLEALRLGCETYASDYNPVAVLILKATLEYPQKFGRPVEREETSDLFGGLLTEKRTVNPLLEAVKKWGDWVLEEARKELARFYPPDPDLPAPRPGKFFVYVLRCSDGSFYIGQTADLQRRLQQHENGKVSWTAPRRPLQIIHWETFDSRAEAVKREKDLKTGFGRKWLKREYKAGRLAARQAGGSIPVGYIWARTIPCQNPACGAEIPLMRQFWLAKKAKKKVALYPEVTRGRVVFCIAGDGYAPWPEGFDPSQGTVSRAVATCPVCGGVVEAKTTRRLFREGKAGQRMVAVVLKHPQRQGKTYRVATEADERVHRQAQAALQAKRERLMLEWGMDPVPDEPLPYDPRNVWITPYFAENRKRWGSLFNPRQQLALITFVEKVRRGHEQIIVEGADPEFATAVATYLALSVDRLADYNSSLCVWHSGKELVAHSFGRQALPMAWDYVEVNPFSDATGNWTGAFGYLIRVLSHCAQISTQSLVSTSTQASAVQLAYPDDHFDAVLTDPPYYDNVNYSALSDFFYVWLKRTVGHLYPDLFSTPLTPKANEIVSDPYRQGGKEAAKQFFEENIKRAFQEIYRVLKPGGVAVIVYAHKSTAGWETITNALLDSGLVMTGAWPLHTEMKARLTARETAALASSIYIVARKMARQPTGFYNEVREELRRHLDRKLQRLWEEGIGGADFFIAAIGSAIEVFGKYEQVMDYEGNIIRADRLLQDVRTIATDYAVRQILRDGFTGEVSDLTRLYVLWRWNFGEARVPFDEARKLAQSCGVDVAREWGRGGFVKKEREFVRLLGPQRRKLDDLEESRELIDVLHRVLLLWEKGRREEMVGALAASGYGRSEAFYRVAQAVSETLPNESKEKKLLDGFLAGRERVREEVGKAGQQRRFCESLSTNGQRINELYQPLFVYSFGIR